jgi:CRISPR-associated protein Csh2
LLVHVEYNDPFFRIGFLEEGLRLDPGRDEAGRQRWLGGSPPTDLADVTLDVAGLAERLDRHRDRLARMRVWRDPQLRLHGEIRAEPGAWLEGV